jgi:excinuclease ABC subunit C
LSRAVAVLGQFELLDKVPLAGLAKQQEELFLPEKPTALLLPRHSQGLYLLQRVRDEAHRFAITAHRKRRGKIGLASRLDTIPGIGPARRKALLARFGSIDGILHASLEDLTAVAGINASLAQVIKSELE